MGENSAITSKNYLSLLSSERELVFVAGHRPIYGNKLRYYLQPFFTERLAKYQEIYIAEHGYEKECPKFTHDGKHDCERCIREFKEPQGKVAIPCPTYPLYSDSVTKVLSYKDLFEVNAGEKSERDEKARAVRLEKEYEARQAAKSKKKVNLVKENKKEEEKADEKPEPIKRSRDVDAFDEENQGRNKVAEDVGAVGNDLDETKGESTLEEQKSEMIYSGTAKFGESISARLEYEKTWEEYINGE